MDTFIIFHIFFLTLSVQYLPNQNKKAVSQKKI